MDYVRRYLGELVAQHRPDLSSVEQGSLIDEIIGFIAGYKPISAEAPLKARAVHGVEDFTSRFPLTTSGDTVLMKSVKIGFVVLCRPEGTVAEVICDELGLGPRLTPGGKLTAIVSPFHLRRAARFLRSVHQGHAAYDCELSILMRSGMVRLFCSGFATASGIVTIGTRGPLAVAIPYELARLAEERPETLAPVLKELAAWKDSKACGLRKLSDQMSFLHQRPAAVPGEPPQIAAEHPSKPGRHRLLELAAHDLLNPVSGILAASQYLLEDTTRILEPHHIVVLSSIESSARLALQLIQNLTEISSIRWGKQQLDFRSTDIVGVVEHAVSATRALADSMKVRVHVTAKSPLPALLADPIKLGEALNGLIANAIGSSHAGSRIEIVVGARAGEATIVMHREGAVAADEPTPAGNRPIAKGPKRGLSEVHAALSSAHAKRIVKAHRGTIRIDAHGSHGYSLTVTLPISTEETARAT